MKMLKFEMICTRMLKRMGMLMLFVVGHLLYDFF